MLASVTLLVTIFGATLTLNCDNLPPGIAKMTLGVDIKTVDFTPLDSKQPDGYRGGVIKFTCDEGKIWQNPYNDITYQMPDQIWSIVSKPSTVMEVDKTIYRSTSDFTSEQKGRFHAKVGGFWGASGSTSYSNKKLLHELMVEDKVVTKAEAFVSTVDSVLASPTILGLSDEVQIVVDELPEDLESNPQPYFDFINYFGTHYISTAEFGGYIQMMFTTSKDFQNINSDSQLSFEAEASFFKFFSANGARSENEKSNSKNFLDTTNKRVTYHGGHTSLLDNKNLQGWEKSVPFNPWLYSGTLIPIYQLINDDEKSESMKRAYESYLSGEGDLYVEGLQLEALNRRIRKAALKYQFVENTTIISSLLDRAENLLEIAYPNASEVAALANDVIFHFEPSDWWKETKLCLKTRRLYYNQNLNNCQYYSPICTAGFQYTPYYYDNTKDSWNTRCVLKWGLFTPIYAEEWFKLTQICYQFNCYNNYTGEFCAPINSYTSEYTDCYSNNGCGMSWMLKTETDDVIPFWFQNTQLCLHLSKNADQCYRSNYRTPICAKHNHWTDYVRDQSNDNRYGCGYKWGMVEILN
ncbi:perivitellin-2 67 kDa subunit-like [Convolutriloba macropyga]|uniref:perivitellin-2 67 kDa subunit-like n=1 Tax=Convolutriloba macropyga TaxID=536237 RepID=UPI003F5276F2